VYTLHPNAFVPANPFGEYLEHLLAEVESDRLQKIPAEAIDLVPLLNGSFESNSLGPDRSLPIK
jgi:hypothetical protein